jgi:hypothetical protein
MSDYHEVAIVFREHPRRKIPVFGSVVQRAQHTSREDGLHWLADCGIKAAAPIRDVSN